MTHSGLPSTDVQMAFCYLASSQWDCRFTWVTWSMQGVTAYHHGYLVGLFLGIDLEIHMFMV